MTIDQPGLIGFAKMAGSSIAGRDAAAWVTDFLNAAYYRRPVGDRDVDDLRFAFSVLTTYWYRSHPSRRLRVTDLRAFHRAFGSDRFAASGRLSREALERGAAELIGDWFPAACADPARRGWGSRFRPSPSMPWHVDKAYGAVREEAQHAFWAQRDDAALSMLHQLAKQIAT